MDDEGILSAEIALVNILHYNSQKILNSEKKTD